MITPTVTWADVDLDETAMRSLAQVARELAPTATGSTTDPAHEGIGALILFLGQNRRQRRLAAEAMAHALNASLLRVDLAAVDSAWVQETEANLDRVFTAAERAGAVLFFDEADALVGRRTEVKDSRDRYTAHSASHLLSRVAAHSDVCILASAVKRHIDHAFLRQAMAEVEFA
jgi:SpoVK/Ycf46/Vps4 family AAA+-type ATPase